jgi:hypothetical protein
MKQIFQLNMRKDRSYQVDLALPLFFQSAELLLEQLAERQLIQAIPPTMYHNGPRAEAMLFELITATSANLKIPYAAISALGLGLNVDSGWWIRLDPTELQVDGGYAYLVGRDHLQLTQFEVEQVLLCLNRLLAEDGMELQAGKAHEWFLCLNHTPEVETFPFHKVLAKDIRTYMPRGLKEKFWRRLLTEFQMLLFQHDVNIKRQSEGRSLLNSVWLWGEGVLTDFYPLKAYTKIWSDCSLVKGLLQHSKMEYALSNIADFKLTDIQHSGHYLMTMDHYQVPLEYLLETITYFIRLVQDRMLPQFSLFTGHGQILIWRTPRRKLFNFIRGTR